MPTDQEIPLEKLKELLSSVDLAQLQQVLPLVGGVITMMFTDIVDSTLVKHAVGDTVYFEALDRHNKAVRECIAHHNGHELKTIGDSFLIAFVNPREAVECGIRVQKALSDTPIRVGNGTIRVRIGLHTGTPIVYRDPVSSRTDLSGTDVDKAARVEGIARGGQVLISEETRVFAGPAAVHDWGLWELKGLANQRIFEVLYPGKQPGMPAGRMRLEPLRFETSFVGREREVAELVDTLKRDRLVTVTGMGGIGKTRLADFAARRLSDSFDDGTFFIELAGTVNLETAVASELVARLGVNLAGLKDEPDALVKTLQNRRALIVLDNFEGVISAAPLVQTLFLGCPSLNLLVTSQAPLNIDGEHIYEVRRMDAPDAVADAKVLAGLDAFQLFRERARARIPEWDVHSSAEAAAVAEILRLVEGIPLSIELAAAWVSSQTLNEIVTGLSKRLSLLKRRGAGGGTRHASMTASLDYSFGLLSDEASELFPKLAVFTGGFFAEDVAAVCGAPNAGSVLVSLHERGLLVRQEILGRTRYSMLATVQEFASDKLPKSAAGPLRRDHAQHFLKVLRSVDRQLGGKEYASALERIAADFGNFEAGMRESQNRGEHRAVMDYVSHLADYLRIQGRFSDCLKLALAARAAAAKLDASNIARADNNLGIAYAGLPTGERSENLRRAIECCESALRVWTERDFPQEWATTQNNLGAAYARLPTGDRGENLRRAIECFEAALRVWTERDFSQDWAMTQNNLGIAYADLPTGDRGENLRRAIECYEAALRVWTEREFPPDWAMTQSNLGNAYAYLPTGDRGENLERAIGCYEAALRVRTERDFPQDWATNQNNLGAAYADLPTGDRGENLKRAIGCFEAAARGFAAVGMKDEADRARAAAKRSKEGKP